MKKFKHIVSGAVLMIAMLSPNTRAASTVGVVPANTGTLLLQSSTTANSGTNAYSAGVTNAYGIWPSAIGSNVVGAAGSTLMMDITNPVRLVVSPAKDLGLEFVGTLAGGTGGAGGTGIASNIVVRIAYDDQPSTITQVSTNGTASRTPNLFTWNINPGTFTGGTVTVDVVTNFTSSANIAAGGNSTLLSLAHANYYVYDVTYGAVTNGAPYLTNYAIYYNTK